MLGQDVLGARAGGARPAQADDIEAAPRDARPQGGPRPRHRSPLARARASTASSRHSSSASPTRRSPRRDRKAKHLAAAQYLTARLGSTPTRSPRSSPRTTSTPTAPSPDDRRRRRDQGPGAREWLTRAGERADVARSHRRRAAVVRGGRRAGRRPASSGRLLERAGDRARAAEPPRGRRGSCYARPSGPDAREAGATTHRARACPAALAQHLVAARAHRGSESRLARGRVRSALRRRAATPTSAISPPSSAACSTSPGTPRRRRRGSKPRSTSAEGLALPAVVCFDAQHQEPDPCAIVRHESEALLRQALRTRGSRTISSSRRCAPTTTLRGARVLWIARRRHVPADSRTRSRSRGGAATGSGRLQLRPVSPRSRL